MPRPPDDSVSTPRPSKVRRTAAASDVATTTASAVTTPNPQPHSDNGDDTLPPSSHTRSRMRSQRPLANQAKAGRSVRRRLLMDLALGDIDCLS